MPLMTPDPTFYPSPAMAMESPRERFGYLALISPRTNGQPDALGVGYLACVRPRSTGRPDAIGVVDLDRGSSTYGRLVGRTDMPEAGDELHHFGWEAGSSRLCSHEPPPHTGARYLPGQ